MTISYPNSSRHSSQGAMFLIWIQVIVVTVMATPQIPLNTSCGQLNTTDDREHVITESGTDVTDCLDLGNIATTNSSDPGLNTDLLNNTNDDSQKVPTTAVLAWKIPFNRFRFFTMAIYMPIVAVLGILGNAITLSVLLKDVLRSNSTIYLLGLTIADMIFTINQIPMTFNVHQAIWSSRLWQSITAFRYSYFITLTSITHTASVWITICFTIERLIVVRWPLKAKELCTRNRTRVAVIGAFVFGLGLNVIRFFFRYVVRNVDPVTQEVYFTYALTDVGRNVTVSAVMFWAYFLLVEFFPFAILACLNSLIIWYVWRARRRRSLMAGSSGTDENKRNSRENQITRLLISMVMAHLLCNTCAGLGSIWGAMYGTSALETTKDPYLYYVITLMYASLLTNPLINCILYVVCSSAMREGIRSKLCLGRNLKAKPDQTKTAALSGKSGEDI